MGRAWIVCCAAAAGCGRIDFNPIGTIAGDASDGAMVDAPAMLSCTGLPPTCGPTGTSSCCGSPLVPGATFYRSFDYGTDNAYIDMSNPAAVSDFRLDTYEITVGRFRQFVDAGMGTQANPPAPGAGARMLNGMAGQGGWDPTWNANLGADGAALVAALKCDPIWQSWTDTPGANEALPMNCITWYDAFAFCVWDGGFLPTEAQWNYAAAGGNDQRAYPWSVPSSQLTIDCSFANYFQIPQYCTSDATGGAPARVGRESPNGDGKYGQADLSGNLWEWTLDWYAATYGNPCVDCAQLVAGTDREVRGGGFDVTSSALRGAGHDFNMTTPDTRGYGVGARCARLP